MPNWLEAVLYLLMYPCLGMAGSSKLKPKGCWVYSEGGDSDIGWKNKKIKRRTQGSMTYARMGTCQMFGSF